jgi:hypothetical protein
MNYETEKAMQTTKTTKPIKTTNPKVRPHVQAKQPFVANNIFAEWVRAGVGYSGTAGEDIYAVYSYGKHFPMYAFIPSVNRWFANVDRYSITTSKHKGQAHPHETCTEVSRDFLRDVLDMGLGNAVVRHEVKVYG